MWRRRDKNGSKECSGAMEGTGSEGSGGAEGILSVVTDSAAHNQLAVGRAVAEKVAKKNDNLACHFACALPLLI